MSQGWQGDLWGPCAWKYGTHCSKSRRKLFLLSELFCFPCQVVFTYYLMLSSLGHRGTFRNRANPQRCLGLHPATWHMRKVCLTPTLLFSGSCWWQMVAVVIRWQRTFPGRWRNRPRQDHVGAKASSPRCTHQCPFRLLSQKQR